MKSLGFLSENWSEGDCSQSRTLKNWSTKKKSIKALLIDDELEIYSFLPKKVIDDVDNDLLAKINGAGEDVKKMYTVCFYGNNSTGTINSFVGRVHTPNEPRNDNLFKRMGLLMAKYGASKRKAADEGEAPSPKK